MLLSFFLLPLFTKKLQPVEFGIIGLLWLINPLLSRVVNLGLDVGVSITFFKQTHVELSKTLYNGLLGMIIMAIITWHLGSLSLSWLQAIIDKGFTLKVFSLLLISVLFSSFLSLMLSFLQNAGKAALNVVMTIIPNLITVLATYLLVIYSQASYISYIQGMALANIMCGTVALLFFLKNYPLRHFSFSLPVLKKLLRVGLPILPGTIGGLILDSSDRFMIKHFLGLEAVAVYTLGYRFAEYIALGLFQPFQKAFSPVLFRKSADDMIEARNYNIKIANRIIIYFSIIMAAVVIPLNDIIVITSGKGYADSFIICLVSLVGIFIYSISTTESSLLIFNQNTLLLMMSTIIGAGLNVYLNYLLIPIYGLLVSAFTTIISYLVMLVLRNYFLYRFFKIRNITQIINRIIPFIVYLYSIVLAEDYIHNSIACYLLKLAMFIVYISFMWLTFSELRELLKPVFVFSSRSQID